MAASLTQLEVNCPAGRNQQRRFVKGREEVACSVFLNSTKPGRIFKATGLSTICAVVTMVKTNQADNSYNHNKSDIKWISLLAFRLNLKGSFFLSSISEFPNHNSVQYRFDQFTCKGRSFSRVHNSSKAQRSL